MSFTGPYCSYDGYYVQTYIKKEPVIIATVLYNIGLGIGFGVGYKIASCIIQRIWKKNK